MSEAKDGGPAFPRFQLDSGAGGCVGGMTLRDWFAGKAMQGMCATNDVAQKWPDCAKKVARPSSKAGAATPAHERT